MTIDLAVQSRSVEELFLKVMCGFNGYTARIAEKESYKLENCANCFHATISWFWCEKIFGLVNRNNQLPIEILTEIADECGYMDKNLIFEDYTEEYLDNPKHRAVPVIPKSGKDWTDIK